MKAYRYRCNTIKLKPASIISNELNCFIIEELLKNFTINNFILCDHMI